MMQQELVIVPGPGIGHLVSSAEFATRLLDRDTSLSITILVVRTPITPDVDAYVQTLVTSDDRIRYIILPLVEPPSLEHLKCVENYITLLIESHKGCIKEAIQDHVLSCSRPLAGLVIDFFFTTLIDVANDFNVPSYIFFPSTAAFLGFMLYVPTHNQKIQKVFDISDGDHDIPTFASPVPTTVLPTVVFDTEVGYNCFLTHGSRFQETDGYIINTFSELELHAVNSLVANKRNPTVYTVGPLLDLKNSERGSSSKRQSIMNWLDRQPDSSVVYLCFGSWGGFEPLQVKEIAIALERSGLRFLWSMRQSRFKVNGVGEPDEFHTLDGILPDGFLERTKDIGMICGWSPQVDVLGHEAIGGFVSHCGWNSTLESLWNGVPMATWPIYAEQQLNAFELVTELGLAVDLKSEHRGSSGEIVGADEIEKAVISLMDKENLVRKRVQAMKEKCKNAVAEGGSSYESMGCFIDKVIAHKLTI